MFVHVERIFVQMTIKVQVTSVIQKVVNGQSEFEIEGSVISELIENIEGKYPGFLQQIADESGELHRFVNVYVNDEDIRFIDGKDTLLNPGDIVAFLPALSGGL